MFISRYRFASLLFILSFFASGLALASQREDAIKSGFIYNFARYSQGEWFNYKDSASYNICSFNKQFVDVAKYTLKDRSIKNVPVSVHLLSPESANLSDCNTLFITQNDTEIWQNLIIDKQFFKLMLVGEFSDFLATGGHINFFSIGGKIRFEVDPIKLQESGINMSSKVLRLGRTHKGNY